MDAVLEHRLPAALRLAGNGHASLLGWALGSLHPLAAAPRSPPASTAAVVSPQTVVPFYNLGVLIALFSPRCSDSLASVRQHAVDCVYCLLYIQLCYEGGCMGRGCGPRPLRGGLASADCCRGAGSGVGGAWVRDLRLSGC